MVDMTVSMRLEADSGDMVSDTRGAEDAVDKLEDEVERLNKTLRTTATKGMKAFGDGVKRAKDQLFSLKSLAATLSVGLISKSFINAASEAEQFEVRLQSLLGSVEEGNRLFDDMSVFAGKVPFEYRDIMASATQLAGVMRGGVDEIKEWMPLIADLAAVSGLGIETTTQQVVRMLSAGAASADLFRERGISAMLGFQTGVTYSAEETREQLIDSWNRTGSQFKGAADRLGRTWSGLMSMFSDKWFVFRNQVMDAGLFDFIKGIGDAFNNYLGVALDNNQDAAKRWSDSIIRFIERTALAGARLVDVLREPTNIVIEGMGAIWAAYTGLPSWAQSAGIMGALMLGPKGMALLAAGGKLLSDTKTTAEWFGAFTSGQVGFMEWLTTGGAEAKEKLDELKKAMEGAGGSLNPGSSQDNPMLKHLLPDANDGSSERKLKEFFLGLRERAEPEAKETGKQIGATIIDGMHGVLGGSTGGGSSSGDKPTEPVVAQAKKTGDDIEQAFESAFDRIDHRVSEFVMGTRFSIRQLAADIISDISKALLKQHVVNPATRIIKGGFDSLIAGLFHSGGIAGDASTMRIVPAGAFAGAQRYHGGGIVGDEVPAILKRGEEVLTENDPRHKNNGGLGGFTINQSIDARGADAGVELRIQQAAKDGADLALAKWAEQMQMNGPLRRIG